MKRTYGCTLVLALAMLVAFAIVPAAVNAGTTTGRPVGSTFVIRADSTEPGVEPAIAYNPDLQEYLVVFWNDRPGCDDIRAERVSRDGKLLGGKWIAAGCPAERRFPDVAYNTQRNEYLIVWVEESGGYNYVRSQRFSADLTDSADGLRRLPAQTSLNLRLAKSFYGAGSDRDRAEIFLRLNNVTDARTDTQVGLPGPGRMLTVGISAWLGG